MKRYVNLTTYEITEIHREAVNWYRAGNEVGILRNNDVDFAVVWVH